MFIIMCTEESVGGKNGVESGLNYVKFLKFK